MSTYKIDLGRVEDLQMIKNIYELDMIFSKAKSAMVQGKGVEVTRKNTGNEVYAVQKITTETDLENFRKKVFKYL